MSSIPEFNDQARKLLRTMCNFLLPLIQTAGGQTTKNLDEILSGLEADRYIGALENFMSDAMYRSQAEGRNFNIEVELQKSTDQNNGLEVPAPDSRASEGGVGGNDTMNQEEISGNRTTSLVHGSFNATFPIEPKLEVLLPKLRSYINENFPIRILCFESYNSNLKISLMEKADVYRHLFRKLQTHYTSSVNERQQVAYFEPSGFETWLANYARYAILSHTWNQEQGEFTYNNWKKGTDTGTPIFRKVANFCKAALEDYGITFGWIDTVCINKESSAELDESIRSMYKWYSNSDVCITYLAETTNLSDMNEDVWFKRGWTFQELVAPSCLKFYGKNWERLILRGGNDKKEASILRIIKKATTMTREELNNIQVLPISRRMELAAKRKVTRDEDLAYCLMGIFSVSISTEYGEGAHRAFFRLVREIFDSSQYVLDIFNWGGTQAQSTKSTTSSSMFPSSPSNYLARSTGNFQHDTWRPVESLTLTHLGLRTTILLTPALLNSAETSDYHSIGYFYATVVASSAGFVADALGLKRHYNLLDKRLFTEIERDLLPNEGRNQFGILNFEGNDTHIRIPKTCFATLLQRTEDHEAKAHSQYYSRIFTQKPIVFDLNLKKNSSISDDKRYYEIERSQLKWHGMQLSTIYL